MPGQRFIDRLIADTLSERYQPCKESGDVPVPTGNLQRAERKVKHRSGREWCGYLTPSEVVALVADGATLVNNHKGELQYLQSEIARGISNPRWTYFYATHAQQKRWGS